MSKRTKILGGTSIGMTQNDFIQQIPLTISVAFVSLILLAFDPQIVTSALFALGVGIILMATCVAILQPISGLRQWQFFYPVMDIAGVALISAHPDAGLLSILLLLPIFWLASSSTRSITLIACFVVSASFVTVTLTTRNSLTSETTMWLFIFPVVVFVLALATNNAGQLIAARGRLLGRQLEESIKVVDREKLKQQSLDFALNATSMSILRIDSLGKTILSNHAHKALIEKFGALPNSDDIDKLFRSDRVTPVSEVDRPFNRALRGVSADREVVWVGNPGEDQRGLLLSVRCFFDARGQPDGAILASRDITEDLITIGYREDFVMTVSHEIRNPLTSIIGNLDLVLDAEELSEQARLSLITASENSLRILDLIKEMLESVSSETTSRSLALIPADLSPLIRQAVRSARAESQARKITVETSTENDLTVDIDSTHMLQVIDNLISNAVKYNVDGGKIRITTRTVKPTNDLGDTDEVPFVELRVTDSGRGISLTEQKQIFQRFYRAKSVRGSSVHGTGLGLHISRELMRSMGGDLFIESVENSGTSAICIFPTSRHSDIASRHMMPQHTTGETRAH